MKLALLKRALASALLMAVALPALAQISPAISSRQLTQGEWALMPEWCVDSQEGPYGSPEGGDGLNRSPRARQWVGLMGQDFWHMHHYCRGLRDMLRLRKAGLTPREREMLTSRAVSEFTYILNNCQPTMPLMPEVLLKKGEVHELQGDLPAALDAFAASMKLKPDYWPAYDRIVSVYLGLKQPDKALAAAEQGLIASPNQPNLLAHVQAIKGVRATSAPARPAHAHAASGSGR